MPKLLPSLVAAVLLSPVLGWAAQGNGAPTVFFKTNVGSFKLLGNENQPANGKIQVSFTGTILVNAVSTSDPRSPLPAISAKNTKRTTTASSDIKLRITALAR